MTIASVLPSSSLTPYFAYVRASMLGMLAYRLRYFTGIITYLLYISIHYFIWSAVFASSGVAGESGRVFGYSLEEMVTYVVIGWIARSLCFSTIDWDIEELVRSGQISVYLSRPVNFQGMMLCQAFGEFVFRLVFFTVPIGLAVLPLFSIEAPASGMNTIFFGFAVLGSFVISAQINFLVGLVAFFIKSIHSLMQAKHYLIQLFSGLLLPLSFFPGWAEQVLSALPFQFITFVPLQIYLGKIEGTAAWGALLQMGLWIVALQIVGHLFWKKSAARLTVQGG